VPTTLPTYTGEDTSLVALTGIELTDALLVGSKWGAEPAGNGASLTFSFPDSVAAFDTSPNVPGNYNPNEVTQSGFAPYLQGFSPFSAEAQEAAREVLQAWANVANLVFTEVAADSVDAGVLRFANSAPPGLGATTYGVSSFPQDFAGAGDTWMNSGFVFPEGWAAGTQNFLTLLHEVGHALGLKHPHDAGMGGNPGWPADAVVLPFTGTDTLTTQSTQTMVMAYNDIPGLASIGGLSVQSDFAPTTPMRYDIAAMQYLYGPNTTYNADDTVYTFDGNGRYNQTIWDAGGIDTIVATGTYSVTIDLGPGSWSKLGLPVTFSTRNPDLSVAELQPQLTDPFTVFIYDTVTIENAIGGDGNDVLIGNAVANWLQGGSGRDIISGQGGNDVVDGGAGSDWLLLSVSTADVLAHPADLVFVPGLLSRVGSSLGVVDLTGIERVRLTDGLYAFDTLAPTQTDAGGKVWQAAALYRAGFGQVPNQAVLSQWTAQADQVADMGDLGQAMINFYAPGVSNEGLVTHLYFMLAGVMPSPQIVQTYAGLIGAGQQFETQGDLFAFAASLPENTAQMPVDFVGSIQTLDATWFPLG